MAVILSIASGWSGILGPFTLKIDGVPLSLAGLTVSLVIINPLGIIVPSGGVATPNPDQATNPGQISYAPAVTDFVIVSGNATHRQAYGIRWKVVDGGGKIVYFPNGEADTISVYI